MGQYWAKMEADNIVNLDAEFEKAAEGRKIWLALEERYHFGIDCGIFIFPTDDSVLNIETIKLSSVYSERFHLRKVYAVTDRRTVIEALRDSDVHDIDEIEISHDEMDMLLKYYRIVNFSSHIAIVSLEEPFGNDYLLRKKSIDLKDFILSSIFKMR